MSPASSVCAAEMPTISTLLASAWAEYRRLPVYNDIVLWLIALPSFGISIIERLGGVGDPYWPDYIAPDGVRWPLFGILLLLNIVIIWGAATTLVAAEHPGKTHTFGALHKQAAPFIVPILLTEVLRVCLTLLWALVLIVPGFIYSLRTMLAQPIIVAEKLAYRPALQRSIQLVKGRSWEVARVIIGTSLLLFLPIGFVTGLIEAVFTAADPRLLALSDALQAAVSGIASAVYIIVLVATYRHLKAHPHAA